MAMEDVVALTNNLVKMLDTSPSSTLTENQIQEALEDCQKSRKRRAKGFSEYSNNMAREETYARVWNKAWTEWVHPQMWDFAASEYLQLCVAMC
jgi:hypothetical protein